MKPQTPSSKLQISPKFQTSNRPALIRAWSLDFLWRHPEGCVSCVVPALELGAWSFFL